VSETSGTSSSALRWLWLALVVIVADQLTKGMIIRSFELYEVVDVLPVLEITRLHNTGAAFSLLAGASGWQRWFFVILATVVSAVIAAWLWRIRRDGQAVLSAGLALVLGGAVGNLIDRIVLGHVTDFIQVWFGSWPFPSFNVADAGISVGAALLIIDALFFSGRDEASKQD